MSNEEFSLAELLSPHEEEEVKALDLLDIILSSSKKGYLNRYTHLSSSEITQISFLEIYSEMLKEDFGIDTKFLKKYLQLFKEHRVSLNREGRKEVIKAITYATEEEEEEKKKLINKLLGK